MSKRAILLINTGSPESLEVRDVRSYIEDFLTDERVMNIPTLVRIPLVKGIIAPRRASKSRDKYALIWEEGGSPLVLRTEELAKEVKRISDTPTLVAMRYNRGSVRRALERVKALGCEELVVVPLFPHYAMSSYESAMAHVLEEWTKGGYEFALMGAAPYYANKIYIDALAEQVCKVAVTGDHLLFSFHGIPVSQTTPYLGNHEKDYEWQCNETTTSLMNHPWIKALQVTHEVAYQSRFGTNKWLSPTLEDRIDKLPREGKRRIVVVCPSFICDCLETTWEISIHLKGQFAGDHLTLVECPNASHTMARAIVDITNQTTTDIIHWTKP